MQEAVAIDVKHSWVLKLLRRLLALAPGRYSIILTVGERQHYDWSVTHLGEVET